MSSSTFSAAHRLYVKSLYRRMLTDSLNWTIHRDLWRRRALVIRAEFEKNRWLRLHVSLRTILNPLSSNVHDPRQLATIFDKAEAELARNQHPDPVICEHSLSGPCLYHLFKRGSLAPLFPGGTKWYVCQFVVPWNNLSTFWYRERNIPVRIPASTPHPLVLQMYSSASNGTSLWSFGGRCCALALVLPSSTGGRSRWLYSIRIHYRPRRIMNSVRRKLWLWILRVAELELLKFLPNCRECRLCTVRFRSSVQK